MRTDSHANTARHRTHHLRVIFGFIAIPLFMLGVIGYFAGFNQAPSLARNGIGMGTFVSVTLQGVDAALLEAGFALATNRLESLEALMSRYRPDSEVSRLNALAGLEALPLSSETYEVLEHARYFHRLSKGAFDITIGPLMAAWGFKHGRMSAEMPDSNVLLAALGLVDSSRLFLSDHAAFLENEGMQIDLGGIAKGYAVDRMLDDLAGLGLTNALVNLGGNIRALGRSPPNLPWKISVRNPFKGEDPIGVLNLESGMAVATSGHYERFVVINNEHLAHIMDPRTGHPVCGMAGVTVLAPTAVEADALSTALFVLGPDAGAELIRRLPGRAALFIPDRQPLEAMATAGFFRHFMPNPMVVTNIAHLD